MNGINHNGEQPTRATLRYAQGENPFTTPEPTPAYPATKRTDNASILVAGLMLLTGILLPIFFPIGLALFLTFVASLVIFGIYALYAAIVYEPTSWGSYGTVWFFASFACVITYFVVLLVGVGPNADSRHSQQACKLYYRTLEANAKGDLSQEDYVIQMLEVEKLTQKSDDPGIKAAGMSSALHKACTQAKY